LIPGDRFLRLVQESRAFSQALGTILRDKQRVFEAFDRFKVELMRGFSQGYVNVGRLLELYLALEPALHPFAGEDVIDIRALTYAVRRLPENIGRTFAFLLTDEVPATYGDPDLIFARVPSSARRRDVWEMLPGKNMVLLRNGSSDLIDFVTCLCLYGVEARKIRDRLKGADVHEALDRLAAAPEKGEREEWRRLPFSEQERSGLATVWPGCTAQHLRDISRHREMFSIDVRRQMNNYNSRRLELWTSQLGDATERLIGFQPSDLPSELRVHIVSSNTHSVTNCLNPWYARNGSRVRDWARREDHPATHLPWSNDVDALYAVARDYFTAHPEEAEDARGAEQRCGILRLEDTASTGIQVQLIDTGQIAGAGIDSGIGTVSEDRRDLIVNIDYAFGEQAEHIIKNLMMLFGANLASLNFLGKAGALHGRRGDVLVPTAFIEQSSDLFQPVPDPEPTDVAALQGALPGNEVHLGPLLTVEGTLLQNRLMLHFYRRIWGCTGIEMEGIHYYRQVLESAQLRVIDPEVRMRFYYYVSDTPLSHGASLASPLSAFEGIPPLYAITRTILRRILQPAGSDQD
jgi:hypothetical protein